MTLRESGAVLLIIGAAVIGPVDPQLTKICRSAMDGGPLVEGLLPLLQNCWEYEETAQTCARAMTEVGATKVLEYGPNQQGRNLLTIEKHSQPPEFIKLYGPIIKTWWSLPPGGVFEPPLHYNEGRGMVRTETYNDKYRVRCIPAPTGLRR